MSRLNMFHDMLKYHLENTDPYDVVIVGDDAALQLCHGIPGRTVRRRYRLSSKV